MSSPFDQLYAAEATALAHRAESVAADVRQRAGALLAAAETCPWDGDAAWAFRTAGRHAVARLRRSATHLDEAAAALRRHGERVGAALAQREAERLRTARHRLHELEDVLHHLGVGR